MEKIVEINATMALLGFGTVGGVLMGVFKFVFTSLSKDRKLINARLDKLEGGTLALLGDKVFHLSQSYLKRGWIRVDELKNLTRLFENYEAHGGNGTAKHLYDLVLELPIKEGGSLV